MSIAFNAYNARPNPAQDIATGLLGMGGAGWLAGTPVNVVASVAAPLPAVAGGAAILPLANQLAYIAANWNNRLETERRVQIDAFIQAVMEPMAPIIAGIKPTRINAEQTVAAVGVVGGVAAGGQVGHGRVDYWIANPTAPGLPTNRFRPSIIVEAKADLGVGHDFGQWQLCAELATMRQLAWNRRHTRGVLTDGVFWRFYELESGPGMVGGPILTHTNAYDVGVALDQVQIIARLRQFVTQYTGAGPLL